jgi:hypothetical protein
MRHFIFVALMGGLSISPAAAERPARVEHQLQRQFEAALENDSSSPSFILITVVDGRTGETRTGCTLAPFLVEAIILERGLGHSPESRARAKAVARQNSEHRFTFSTPAALRNVPFGPDQKSEEACRVLRQGFSARLADRTGQVIAGDP